MKMTDVYWQFANERLRMYKRRLKGKEPLTEDPILQQYRFTNAYRASDRVSQYLIRIQYNDSYEDSPREIFFRTMLFKLFNKLETWRLIKGACDPHSRNLGYIKRLIETRDRLYSAAYIQASPGKAGERKAAAHMDLIQEMLDAKLYKKIHKAESLRQVFNLLKEVRSFGDFLAYQYTIDLNYSTLIDFDEDDFVVPGPGALDGISKVLPGYDPVDAIMYMTDMGYDMMKDTLFGRPLHLIDCQNLFCEISKYTRVSHPKIIGVSGRTSIKQNYTPLHRPLPKPFFPPKWGLKY